MAAIATSVVLSPLPRVGVTLSAWTNGPVVLTRVHADGSRVPVRGVPDASGGTTFVFDDETILGEAFTYEAYSGASLVTSSPVTVAWTDELLSVPGMPQMAYRVYGIAVPAAKMSRDTAVLDSPFRSMPPVEYGELGSGRFDITFRAYSVADRIAIETIVRQSGVLLLRVPLTEYGAIYVVVSDLDRAPRVHYRREGVATNTLADRRLLTLTCIETSSPVGGSFGDPTASYQALVDSGKTYQQLLDWKGVGATTYLDMLKGGF